MNWLRDRRLRILNALRPERAADDAGRGDSTRAALINRKAAVQAEAAQIRQELGRLRGSGRDGLRVDELEARLSRLATEEHRLRLQIDRTRHQPPSR